MSQFPNFSSGLDGQGDNLGDSPQITVWGDGEHKVAPPPAYSAIDSMDSTSPRSKRPDRKKKSLESSTEIPG